MTLASAIAIRGGADLNFVATFSDSRLSLGASAVGHTDYALKAVGLGTRSAVLMAGTTVLPTVAAAECARGLISNLATNRAEAGQPPPSLLVEARCFLDAFAPCCTAFKEFHFSVEVLIAGFYSDGVPGIVKVQYLDGTGKVSTHRPSRGAFAVASIGESHYASIATRAVISALREKTVHAAVERTGSVFWDIICHQGVQGIGGGLSIGFCHEKHTVWQWPMFEIDGRVFYRGMPLDKIPDAWAPSAMHFTRDHNAFALAERENVGDEHSLDWPAPHLVGGVADTVQREEAWPTAEEAALLRIHL